MSVGDSPRWLVLRDLEIDRVRAQYDTVSLS